MSDSEDSPEQLETFGADDYQPVERGDLPDLNDVILDEPTLLQLFEDIRALGQILGVNARGHGARRRASDENIAFDAAKELFLTQAVNGLQIRYIFEGQEWWDTLMHTPEGVRLVRIQQHF